MSPGELGSTKTAKTIVKMASAPQPKFCEWLESVRIQLNSSKKGDSYYSDMLLDGAGEGELLSTSEARYSSTGSLRWAGRMRLFMNSIWSFRDLFSVSSLAFDSCSCEFYFLRYYTSCSRSSNAFFFLPLTRVALSLF